MSDDNSNGKGWGEDHGPTHEQTTKTHIHNEGLKDGGAQAHLGYIPENSQTAEAIHPESEKQKKDKDNWEHIKRLKRLENDMRSMMDDLTNLLAEIKHRKQNLNLLEKARRNDDLDAAKDVLMTQYFINVDGFTVQQVWDEVGRIAGEEKITIAELEQRAIELEEHIQQKLDENPELDAELRQEFSEKLNALKQDGLDGGLSEHEVDEAIENTRFYNYDRPVSLLLDSHGDERLTTNSRIAFSSEENPFPSAGNITAPFNKAVQGTEHIEPNSSPPTPSKTPQSPTMG